MKESIKISIIVPVYNVKDYLRECLDSLVNQTFTACEIILVNDGSTDSSDLICREYAEKCDRVSYYSQSNQGQSVARNVGVAHSRGDYILFVDSDDYISRDACEVLYKNAIQYDVDIVIGDLLNEKDRIYADPTFRAIPDENKRLSVKQYCQEAFKCHIYDIVPWIRLVKRQYLLKNGIEFLEGCYYEDHEYSMRIFTTNNGSVVKIRFPFYFYRVDRAGSTTNYASPKKGEDFICVIKKMHRNMADIDEETQQTALPILGLAYYHFSGLWLRIPYADGKDLKKTFRAVLTASRFSDAALNCLDSKMRQRVNNVLYRPLITKAIWKMKALIKQIV